MNFLEQDLYEKKICVIGMGYVGLTLALTFSDIGFKVIGIEKREKVIEKLKQGKSHFYEKGLGEILQRELGKGFDFKTSIEEPLSDIYIVAVGTPIDNDKKPNYQDLKNVSEMLGKVLKRGDLVVLRPTIPPGTARNFVLPILEEKSSLRGGKDFFLAMVPERTIEGKAIEELRTLPQVIGGLGEKCGLLAAKLFEKITPKIIMVDSLETAEMVKFINNTFRDLKFAFSNEIALICSKFNLDTKKVIEAANFGYPRGGVPFPSPGVGGYCLTKDAYLLIDALEKKDFKPKLIPVSRLVNEAMPSFVAKQVERFFRKFKPKNLENGKIYILGFAFKGKPETSDIRFSPTLDVVNLLLPKFKNIWGYDLVVKKSVIENFGVRYAYFKEGFEDADCIIIMNNHPDFASLDVVRYLQITKKPVLFFDTWRLHDPQKVFKVKEVKYTNLGFDNFSTD